MNPNTINEIIGGSGPEENRALELRVYFEKYSEKDQIIGSNFMTQYSKLEFINGYSIHNLANLKDYAINTKIYIKKIIKDRLKVITPTFYYILKEYGFNICMYNIYFLNYILRYLIKYQNNKVYYLFKNEFLAQENFKSCFLDSYRNLKYICKYGVIEHLNSILEEFLNGFKKTRELRIDQEQKDMEKNICYVFKEACDGLKKNSRCIDCLKILVAIMEEYEIEANVDIWYGAFISKNINVINLVTTLKFNYNTKFTFLHIEHEEYECDGYYEETDSAFVTGNGLACALFNSSPEMFKYLLYNIPEFNPQVMCIYDEMEFSLLDLAKMIKNEKYQILLEFLENQKNK